MSRINACFNAAVAAGRMSRQRAAEASARIEELEGKGIPTADAMAKVAEELREAAQRHARQTSLRIMKSDEALRLAQSHPSGLTPGILSLFSRDLRGKVFHSNIESRARAVRGLAHARLVDVLDRFRSRFLGFTRDQAGLQEMVRGLYGTSNDPAIQALARAWNETAEMLRSRFEAAGGYLPALQTWRLPQVWDGDAVRAAGQGRFTAYLQDALANGRLAIRDLDTGQAVTGTRADEIIRNAWHRISSDGLSDLVPGQAGGQGSLANSRSAARAFDWQTPDAWLDANRQFGRGDAGIFDLLNQHVDGMSRDIAMLEVLGPNPDWTVRWLRDQAIQAEPTRAGTNGEAIDRYWDTISGRSSTPVSSTMAAIFDNVRGFLTSAQLGAAYISSASDLANAGITARFNGLSATGTLRGYLQMMNPANAADRALAVRHGLIAESWATRASGGLRFMADTQGVGLGTRAADTIMRLSLLTPHTQAMKNAFGMEFLGTLADRAARSFDQLDPRLRGAMERYGISAADWDVIRQHGVVRQGNVAFVSPDDLARSGADPDARAATRLLEMIQSETRYAIPEPGASERAVTLRGTQRGTWQGEFFRSAMQYKSFPVTVMTTHLVRALNAARRGDYGRYLVTMAVGMTVAGAFAIQMKQIAQGKDPRNMADWQFWAAAMAQGGGAGLLGDFIYSAVSRTDSSFYLNTFGGPLAGLMDDVARVAGMNFQALSDEQRERSFGADVARFVRRNAPGTSLWYSRLATDRVLWDSLQEMVDPDAHRRWRQIERRALRDYDQDFWWRPGDSAPARAPALDAGLGGLMP